MELLVSFSTTIVVEGEGDEPILSRILSVTLLLSLLHHALLDFDILFSMGQEF